MLCFLLNLNFLGFCRKYGQRNVVCSCSLCQHFIVGHDLHGYDQHNFRQNSVLQLIVFLSSMVADGHFVVNVGCTFQYIPGVRWMESHIFLDLWSEVIKNQRFPFIFHYEKSQCVLATNIYKSVIILIGFFDTYRDKQLRRYFQNDNCGTNLVSKSIIQG